MINESFPIRSRKELDLLIEELKDLRDKLPVDDVQPGSAGK